jgi:hypothetical protein
MAALRPKILVTQSFSNPSFSASIPDLNGLIVGPAYEIHDYITEKANIVMPGVYGSLTATCVNNTGSMTGQPVTGTPAVTAGTPPGMTGNGSILDSASVKIYLDDVQVEIATGIAGSFPLNFASTSTSVQNSESTFEDAAVNFVTLGVLAGDRLVITDTGNATTIARTVKSAPTTANVDRLILSQNWVATTTTDLPDILGAAGGTVADTALDWRIERRLDDQVVATADVTVTGQQVEIDGGVTLEADIGGVLTAFPVNYGVPYQQYRALRQDLAVVTDVTNTGDIAGLLGLVDERNPLAAAAQVALSNTASPIKVFGVRNDNLNGATDVNTGHLEATSAIESREDIYAVCPLSADSSVIATWRAHVVQMSVPERSNFRIAIGSADLPTTANVVLQSACDVQVGDTADPITVFIDPLEDFVAGLVAPGDILTVSASGTPGNIAIASYEVLRVLGTTFLEIDATPASGTNASAVGAAEGTSANVTYTISGTGTAAGVGVTCESRRRFSIIRDNTANFLVDGVLPGDILQTDQAGTPFTGSQLEFVVASVLNANDIKINLVSANSPLPNTTSGADPLTGAVYRVQRNLSATGQVDALNAVTQGLLDRRMTMVWPDTVYPAGLQNASTGTSTGQPGYYLGCALLGQISGYSPHQNFTRLGVAGISTINNSNDLFSVDQIDALSNGGWYVFLQDVPASVPYSVHALTTDTGALETGELMIIKNFDFVSLFYKNLLKQFLQGYNVLPEVLDLISSAFDAGTGQLKSRKELKIGIPLISARIESIYIKEGSADTVELLASVELPRPLNRIGLFLSA